MKDEELMLAYGKGDFDAFQELYARYRGPLYRYLLRLINNEATANDLFQQTWEKVIKAAPGYRAATPFKAWLYVIARNSAMDHFRQVQRRSEGELTDQLAADTESPEDKTADALKARNLAEAIDRLPVEQRDTLMLRLAAGLKLDAIAQVTGASQEATKSRLRYAIGKLKQSLGENDEL